MVQGAVLSDDEENEAPMLGEEMQIDKHRDERLEEELAEAQWQQIPPYQLTQYYHNELACFDEAYLRWVNERYDQERLLFEQQQENLYNTAVVFGAGVGGQQGQQLEEQHNVPEHHINNDDDAKDEEDDNIIIAPQQEEEGKHIIINAVDNGGGDNGP